jgi:hypothetical protein
MFYPPENHILCQDTGSVSVKIFFFFLSKYHPSIVFIAAFISCVFAAEITTTDNGIPFLSVSK